MRRVLSTLFFLSVLAAIGVAQIKPIVTPGSGGGGAPATATFITQTPDGGLSAEQALSALATGLMKNTFTTGVVSIAAAGTDYSAGTAALGTGLLKSTTGTGALTIATSTDLPWPLTAPTGGVIRTGTTASDTLSLAAYDVDGAAYTNLLTLTAGNTPTLALTGTINVDTGLNIRRADDTTKYFKLINQTADASILTGNNQDFVIKNYDGTVDVMRVTTAGILTLGTVSSFDRLAITPVAKGSNAYLGTVTSSDLTAARTWTFPDATGTVAMTSAVTGSGTCTVTAITAGIITGGSCTEPSPIPDQLTADEITELRGLLALMRGTR